MVGQAIGLSGQLAGTVGGDGQRGFVLAGQGRFESGGHGRYQGFGHLFSEADAPVLSPVEGVAFLQVFDLDGNVTHNMFPRQ
jgi:hypothetical protein